MFDASFFAPRYFPNRYFTENSPIPVADATARLFATLIGPGEINSGAPRAYSIPPAARKGP